MLLLKSSSDPGGGHQDSLGTISRYYGCIYTAIPSIPLTWTLHDQRMTDFINDTLPRSYNPTSIIITINTAAIIPIRIPVVAVQDAVVAPWSWTGHART